MYFNRFSKLEFKPKQQSGYIVLANPETSIHSMISSILPKMHACRCNCSDPQPDPQRPREMSCAIGSCSGTGCIMKNSQTDVSLCCFDGSGGSGCNTSEYLCGIGSATTLCGRPIDKCGPSPGPKKKNIVAYFINWGKQLSKEQMIGLKYATHVIVAFAVNYKYVQPPSTPSFSSCKIPLNFDHPNKSNNHANFINTVKNINPSIKILVSIGGWNMNAGWTKCLGTGTDNDISDSATQMIKLFQNPDGNSGSRYDGIDIDMENTNDNNVIINTGKLVKELIRQRANEKWLITIVPMSGQILDTSYVEHIIKPNPEIDLINVQNYNTPSPRWTPGCSSHGANVCENFKKAMKFAGISAEKIVPMIATNGPGDGCKWRCENGDDCSNNVTNININQVACAYHKIDPNFGGLGYWAFNQDNIETGEAPASPQLLVQGLSDALNNLEGCSTCLAPLEC